MTHASVHEVIEAVEENREYSLYKKDPQWHLKESNNGNEAKERKGEAKWKTSTPQH